MGPMEHSSFVIGASGRILASMSERFYVNCPLSPGDVVLQGAEAHHLAVVCRLRPGQQVCLFNGDGHEYPAEITQVGRKRVELHVREAHAVSRELPFRLMVASALPKGDRDQFLIEKLTEVGVTAFVPLQTQRSVVHPGEARSEKLRRYVIEASKQCGRNVLMDVEPLSRWESFVHRPDLPGRRLLAHPGGQPAKSLCSPATDTVLAVGPEGGFTDEELASTFAAGWQAVDLGSRILRVETAAVGLAFLLASLEGLPAS
jgi:16S rRNA (uracil1498-N3)-methyltransferase